MRKLTLGIELGEAARRERGAIFDRVESYEVLEVLKMDFEQALFVDLIECVPREGVSVDDLDRIGNMEVLSVVRSEGNRHTLLVKGRAEGDAKAEYESLDLDLVYTTPSFHSEDRSVISVIGAEESLRRFVALVRASGVGRITDLTFTRSTYPRRDILSVLTDRQKEVMIAAHRHGYYEIPRRTSSSRLAKTIGISRPTLLEHLRKAERRIVSEIMAGQTGQGRRAAGPRLTLAG